MALTKMRPANLLKQQRAGDYTVNFKNNPAMTNPAAASWECGSVLPWIRVYGKTYGTAFSGGSWRLRSHLWPIHQRYSASEHVGIIGQRLKVTLQFTPQYWSNDESKKAAIGYNCSTSCWDNAGNTLTADGDGWYSTAEGRYKNTKGANVDVIFEPSTGYIGTTQEINIRRVDTNGASRRIMGNPHQR